MKLIGRDYLIFNSKGKRIDAQQGRDSKEALEKFKNTKKGKKARGKDIYIAPRRAFRRKKIPK